MGLQVFFLLILCATSLSAQTLGRLPGTIYLSDRGPRVAGTIDRALASRGSSPAEWVFDGHWNIESSVQFSAGDTVYALPGTVLELASNTVMRFGGAGLIAPYGFSFDGAGTTDGTARYPHRFESWGSAAGYNLKPGFLDYTPLDASNVVSMLALSRIPTGTLDRVVRYLDTNSVSGFGVYAELAAYTSNTVQQILATNAYFATNMTVATTNLLRIAENSAMAVTPVGSIVGVCGGVPAGWLECDGSLISVDVYSGLFGVIGYTYGGSAGSFALPDLRGRLTVMAGVSTNMDAMGETGGASTCVLTTAQLPSHTHIIYIYATNNDGSTANSAAQGETGHIGSFDVNSGSISSAGSSAAHNNLQPYLVVRKVIRY